MLPGQIVVVGVCMCAGCEVLLYMSTRPAVWCCMPMHLSGEELMLDTYGLRLKSWGPVVTSRGSHFRRRARKKLAVGAAMSSGGSNDGDSPTAGEEDALPVSRPSVPAPPPPSTRAPPRRVQRPKGAVNFSQWLQQEGVAEGSSAAPAAAATPLAAEDATRLHDLCQQLFTAANKGKAADVRRLLGLGAPTSGPIVQKVSRELVKVGADDRKKKFPDDDSGAELVAPMHIAAQAGHVECLQALLDAEAEVDVLTSPRKLTPLYFASLQGHLACVKALIDGGATVTRGSPQSYLLQSSHKSFPEIVSSLLAAKAPVDDADSTGQTPLQYAVNKSEGEFSRPIASMLLEAGASVNRTNNAREWSPLLLACSRGNAAAVEMLVEHGATVNILADQSRMSPLLLACENAAATCVHMLVDARANIEYQAPDTPEDPGCCALHMSCRDRRGLDCVRELLAAGACVNAALATPLENYQQWERKAGLGETPLWTAVEYGNPRCVSLLLGAKADIHRTYGSYEHGYGWGVHDKAPAKVLDAAIFFGEKECERVLRSAGAISLAEAAAAAAMEALLQEEEEDKEGKEGGGKKKKNKKKNKGAAGPAGNAPTPAAEEATSAAPVASSASSAAPAVVSTAKAKAAGEQPRTAPPSSSAPPPAGAGGEKPASGPSAPDSRPGGGGASSCSNGSTAAPARSEAAEAAAHAEAMRILHVLRTSREPNELQQAVGNAEKHADDLPALVTEAAAAKKRLSKLQKALGEDDDGRRAANRAAAPSPSVAAATPGSSADGVGGTLSKKELAARRKAEAEEERQRAERAERVEKEARQEHASTMRALHACSAAKTAEELTTAIDSANKWKGKLSALDQELTSACERLKDLQLRQTRERQQAADEAEKHSRAERLAQIGDEGLAKLAMSARRPAAAVGSIGVPRALMEQEMQQRANEMALELMLDDDCPTDVSNVGGHASLKKADLTGTTRRKEERKQTVGLPTPPAFAWHDLSAEDSSISAPAGLPPPTGRAPPACPPAGLPAGLPAGTGLPAGLPPPVGAIGPTKGTPSIGAIGTAIGAGTIGTIGAIGSGGVGTIGSGRSSVGVSSNGDHVGENRATAAIVSGGSPLGGLRRPEALRQPPAPRQPETINSRLLDWTEASGFSAAVRDFLETLRPSPHYIHAHQALRDQLQAAVAAILTNVGGALSPIGSASSGLLLAGGSLDLTLLFEPPGAPESVRMPVDMQKSIVTRLVAGVRAAKSRGHLPFIVDCQAVVRMRVPPIVRLRTQWPGARATLDLPETPPSYFPWHGELPCAYPPLTHHVPHASLVVGAVMRAPDRLAPATLVPEVRKIDVDISISNRLALWNTALVQTYMSLDERARELCLFVKAWANRCALAAIRLPSCTQSPPP